MRFLLSFTQVLSVWAVFLHKVAHITLGILLTVLQKKILFTRKSEALFFNVKLIFFLIILEGCSIKYKKYHLHRATSF